MMNKPSTQSRALLAGAVIVLAGLWAYANSFSGPFVFDDFPSVLHNPTIRHLWPIWDALGRDGRDRRALGEHIPGHLQHGRARPPLAHLPECLGDPAWRECGMLDACHRLGEPGHRAELIGHFVQVATALVQEGRGTWPVRHSTGWFQPQAVSNPAPALRMPGPGTTVHTAGPACRAGVAEGHVAAGLLMTRTDGTHLRLRALQGIEESVGLRTGQPKHRVDLWAISASTSASPPVRWLAVELKPRSATVRARRRTRHPLPGRHRSKRSRAPTSRFSGARSSRWHRARGPHEYQADQGGPARIQVHPEQPDRGHEHHQHLQVTRRN